MKKTFGLIRIDAVTLTELKHAESMLTKRLEATRRELDGNGARVRLSWGNGNDRQAVQRVVGELDLWTNNGLETAKHRKGFWARLGDELNGLLDEE